MSSDSILKDVKPPGDGKLNTEQRDPQPVADDLADSTSSSVTYAVSATLLINDKPVIVKSDSEVGLKFSIHEPVVIGNVGDFKKWLENTVGMKVELPDGSKLPENLKDAYERFMDGQLEIDVLSIDTGLRFYQFGASLDLGEKPITLLKNLKFQKIGVVVMKQAISSTLQAKLGLDESQLTVAKGDGQKFSSGDTIQIGDEYMTITKVESDTVTVDRTEAASTKAPHENKTIIWVTSR